MRPAILWASLATVALADPQCSADTSQVANCDALLDFALVVDNSKSITTGPAADAGVPSKITTFLTSFMNKFSDGLASGQVQFSLVAFASYGDVLQPLTSDEATLDGKAASRGSQGDTTNIVDALGRGRDAVFGAGSRAGSTKIILLLTDGQDTVQGPAAAIAEAAAIKAQTVQVFGIGFGDANETMLREIASSPASEYSFLGDSVDSVIGRTETIKETVCTEVHQVCLLSSRCSLGAGGGAAAEVQVTGQGMVNTGGELQCRLDEGGGGASYTVPAAWVSGTEVTCSIPEWESFAATRTLSVSVSIDGGAHFTAPPVDIDVGDCTTPPPPLASSARW